MKKGLIRIKFPMGDGVNMTDAPTEIGTKHVQKAQNAILTDRGFIRAPGSRGLAGTTFTGPIRELFSFKADSGTEFLHAASGGILRQVARDTGVLSTRYTLAGDSRGQMAAHQNMLWFADGNDVIKGEYNSTNLNFDFYPVGLAAPAAGTSGKSAGGTLGDGVYQIVVCFARSVGGVTVIYSTGYALSNQTLGTGDNTISITGLAATHTDSQINKYAVFMTDAGGSVYYLYKTVDLAASITIADTTERNANIVYTTYASDNYRPAAAKYLKIFDNRLVLGNSTAYPKRVWYSQRGTVYDLERFGAAAYADYPFQVNGIFSLGQHLYISTLGGVYRQPYGDFSQAMEKCSGDYWIWDIRTLAYYGGYILVLTNDGVRMFTEAGFQDIDISHGMRPEIQKIYDSGVNPCAIIYKRDIRTEYQLAYCDRSLISGTDYFNNRRIVLNLTRLAFYGGGRFTAPWDGPWSPGADVMTIDSTGEVFYGQNKSAEALIYNEIAVNHNDDYLVYGDDGIKINVPTAKTSDVKTREYLGDVGARLYVKCLEFYGILVKDVNFAVSVQNGKEADSGTQATKNTGSKFGVARFGIGRFSVAYMHKYKKYVPRNISGYTLDVEITNEGDDPDFKFEDLLITAQVKSGRRQ